MKAGLIPETADREWEGRVYRADVLDKGWLALNPVEPETGQFQTLKIASRDTQRRAMAACDTLLVTAQK